MNMLSFLGETPTQALRNAQKECGEDAIVISTKKIADKKTSGKDMYEVVVALEEEYEKHQKIPKQKIVKKTHTEDVVHTEFIAQFYDFKAEILKMQETILNVQKSLWSPKSQLFDLTVPIEFVDIYNLFEQNEFDSEMTYTILKKTIQQLPPALKANQIGRAHV